MSDLYKGKIKKDEETVVPDSTTNIEKFHTEFYAGEDVLSKQKDGRYYLGTVVQVNIHKEQCLVKFGDNTEDWSDFKNLTKLSNLEQEDLFCVVCKKSSHKNKHEIIVCDKCGRGYHLNCHQPEIAERYQKGDISWMCKRCLDNEPKKNDFQTSRKSTLRNLNCSNSDRQSASSTILKLLPYQLNSLTWDTYHRVNIEQIYCYCGRHGEWYKQMIQCGRCRQWFHERCVDCLQYPLYCGDRFYVFICGVCNYGKEFLRRFELGWVDVVHMMLFNLTVYHSKKYYDLDNVIIPYINDNWNELQLPPSILSVSQIDRRSHILSVLTNNKNRFKCGREIKKRTTIWGLRVRLPPPAPCFSLPMSGAISEEDLKTLWDGNRRLRLLPLDYIYAGSLRNNKSDKSIKQMMMGVAYQQSCDQSESDSPCSSSETREHFLHSTKIKILKSKYIGAGCAKKSVPLSKLGLKKRRKLLSLNVREKIVKRPKRAGVGDVVYSEDRGRKHKIKSRNYVQDTENNEIISASSTFLSAPPTPPASGSSYLETNSDYFENSNTGTLKSKISKSLLVDCSIGELNTFGDTSGDETSSKSTLDLIIPPPKDFEGKNNPFIALMKGNIEETKKNKDCITLPLPLTAVIPSKPNSRLLKRKLSEKDIFIGPNGEVKKRKLRKSRSSHSLNSLTSFVSKSADITPSKSNNKDWLNASNCVDYSFSTKRLRQRPEKTHDKEPVSNSSTPKPSPVKQESDISINDLKSSVNMYFGAANRISAGERFTIRAKRFGPLGKIEYLIEWDGSSNGMA